MVAFGHVYPFRPVIPRLTLVSKLSSAMHDSAKGACSSAYECGKTKMRRKKKEKLNKCVIKVPSRVPFDLSSSPDHFHAGI